MNCRNDILCAAALLALAAPSLAAQSGVPSWELPTRRTDSSAALSSPLTLAPPLQQPAGAPPTPRHTGIRAMGKELVADIVHLPSRENAMWAVIGGGLALAAHPADDHVNEALVGSDSAKSFFKAGAVLGQLGTLLGSSVVVYAVGRISDEPRVSHVGMDLIRSLLIAEAITQTLKYSTRRLRPDGSSYTSFPSGHAADTFAFATALERHLNWRFAVPAYAFASYVAISRLPANRHWLSDAVFGSAVGIIAGRTVTAPNRDKYPIEVVPLAGGVGVFFVRGQTQNR
jgi:membrane-associated phospholipid phosphatase